MQSANDLQRALQELCEEEQDFIQKRVAQSVSLPAPSTTTILHEVLNELNDRNRHALQATLRCYKQNRMSDEGLIGSVKSLVKSLTDFTTTRKILFKGENKAPAAVNTFDHVTRRAVVTQALRTGRLPAHMSIRRPLYKVNAIS